MSLTKVPPDFRSTYEPYIKIYQYVGIDIYENREKISPLKLTKIMLLVTFFGVSFISALVTIYLSFERGMSFVEILKMVNSLFVFIQAILSMVVMTTKRNEIRQIIYDIGQLWPDQSQTSEENFELIKKWTHMPKVVASNVMIGSFISTITFHWYPVMITFCQRRTNPEAKFLFSMLYYPFEIKTVPVYLTVVVVQWISVHIMYFLVHLGCVLLSSTFVLNLGLLLKLLQNELKNIFTAKSKTLLKAEDTEDYNKLKQFIKNHQKLLDLNKKINKIFAWTYFVPSICYAILLAVGGFLTVVDSWYSLNQVFVILAVVFVMMWPGQLVTDASSGMAEAAYESLWYEQSLRIRKVILSIIIRSQAADSISPFGLVKFNLETFFTILSSAWSYVSILDHLYKRNNNE